MQDLKYVRRAAIHGGWFSGVGGGFSAPRRRVRHP